MEENRIVNATQLRAYHKKSDFEKLLSVSRMTLYKVVWCLDQGETLKDHPRKVKH